MEDNFQKAIDSTVQCLHDGGVILYLSDTIWGLGCDAENERAIRRIFSIKNRDLDKPLISLVSDLSMLKRYTPQLHPRIETLLHYHTRPVTVVHPQVKYIAYPAKSAKNDAGIRIIQVEPMASVIKTFGKAITSTSANISGKPFPASYSELDPKILDAVDLILPSPDYDQPKSPSSVISYTEKGELIVLRD